MDERSGNYSGLKVEEDVLKLEIDAKAETEHEQQHRAYENLNYAAHQLSVLWVADYNNACYQLRCAYAVEKKKVADIANNPNHNAD